MSVTTISVTLELTLEGDALSGRATDAAGEVHPFVGWIGLAGVIEMLGQSPGEEERSGAEAARRPPGE